MDDFKRNVEKHKTEVRIVIAFILLTPVIALVAALFIHYREEDKIVKNYLEHERPDVVLAIEAYKAANGHFPESITNAVPHYYKGKQERLFFLEKYEYKNFGTNFFLKDFNPPN